MDKPPRRLDRLALAVLSAAAIVVVAVIGYLAYRLASDAPEVAPAAKAPTDTRLAICSIDLSVDNRHMAGRGAVGVSGETPDFSRHHQEALMGAVNRAIDKKL